MFVPVWLLVVAVLLLTGLATWTFLLATGRNPLPFPDSGSRIFSAASPEAKDAVVALLREHGLRERFQFNTGGVLRSIMWDGTIINHPSPEVMEKLALPLPASVLSRVIQREAPNARQRFSNPADFSARSFWTPSQSFRLHLSSPTQCPARCSIFAST